MYNDSSAYTKDKDMWLAELDFDRTDDTDMLSAANSDSTNILLFLWTALDDFSKKGDSFVSLRTLWTLICLTMMTKISIHNS
jgi:hypothetical protein